MQFTYAHVALPLAFRQMLTYSVPDSLVAGVAVGCRVVVPLRGKRYFTALVIEVEQKHELLPSLKEVAAVLDLVPLVLPSQLSLWKWAAEYYLSGVGAFMQAALPAAMRTSSQTVMVATGLLPDDALAPELTDVFELLQHGPMALEKLEQRTGSVSAHRVMNALVSLGLADVMEAMPEVEKPKMIPWLKFSESAGEPENLKAWFDRLAKAPKQLEALMQLTSISGYTDGLSVPVTRQKFLVQSHSDGSALNQLIAKGIIEVFWKLEGEREEQPQAAVVLSEAQREACTSINLAFESGTGALLHGVTGSGKTEVYAEVAKAHLAAGEQVLFLVPEIALTDQLARRLQYLLGAEVHTYHSRMSARERYTLWHKMLSSEAPLVLLGARSAVLLPFAKLGLVVIDEEHETSYKQAEAHPHYHARDLAMMLAKQSGANLLLGSATPSLESVNNAAMGKLKLVPLTQRYTKTNLPAWQVVDLRLARANHEMQGEFSHECIEAIRATVAAGKQAIVFQNRRGYSPFLICQQCGWVGECNRCDVSLTHHKAIKKMVCHYCGKRQPEPQRCPTCGSVKLQSQGYGTERIEAELEELLPNVRFARMDLETTRQRGALRSIVSAFESRSVDVLVGTQMVTKGLDFEHVSLVVVLNADALWFRNDFRAAERAFQLLTQVAGRAGRRLQQGTVMVQTYKPDHAVLKLAAAGDYKAFYDWQLGDRQQFFYPPFSRMVRFETAHTDEVLAAGSADFLATTLISQRIGEVLGPERPTVGKINNRYRRHLFLKLSNPHSVRSTRQAISQCIEQLEQHQTYRKVRLDVDVDPS